MVFDGEENFLFSHEVLPDHPFRSFKRLNHKIISDLGIGLLEIAEKLGLTKDTITGLYRSLPEDLSVLVKETDRGLHFVSAGETQPGRYKIFYLGYAEL